MFDECVFQYSLSTRSGGCCFLAKSGGFAAISAEDLARERVNVYKNKNRKGKKAGHFHGGIEKQKRGRMEWNRRRRQGEKTKYRGKSGWTEECGS